MPEKPSLDPVELDPDKFEVRLDNERVRVLEVRMLPGAKHAMHWHPAHLIYALTSYTFKDTYPDGTTKVGQRRAGGIVWSNELTHAAENFGNSPIHALIIELNEQSSA